ncbi:MAG: DUF4913 domain-containing protein [Salinibacterium sp.]|nr:DUF4913 domain-containing protein [Salinibacterium sp.]
MSRLDGLSRCSEALHFELTFGMSAWWCAHADHHRRMIVLPDGPVADSRGFNGSARIWHLLGIALRAGRPVLTSSRSAAAAGMRGSRGSPTDRA